MGSRTPSRSVSGYQLGLGGSIGCTYDRLMHHPHPTNQSIIPTVNVTITKDVALEYARTHTQNGGPVFSIVLLVRQRTRK